MMKMKHYQNTRSLISAIHCPYHPRTAAYLEQLVDDRLQKAPVIAQETRVLPDHIHDVGRDDGLVVLAALDLDEAEELLDDGDDKHLLLLRTEGRW